MTPSLERWPTKAKEAPSRHEVRLALLDTNQVFQSLRGNFRHKYCINKIKTDKSYSNKCIKKLS